MEYVFLISVVMVINFTMSALCLFEYLDRGKRGFGWLSMLAFTGGIIGLALIFVE
tara:strand:+ start:491 stop:655 length:165 start_codon:yes stop_codon:yes gene_type:complete